MPLARALGVPLLLTHHGYNVTTEDRRWLVTCMRLYLKRRARLYRGRRWCSVFRSFVREKAVRKGAPPHKTLVHYIGIDLASFTPDPSIRAPTLYCSSAGWSKIKDASSCCMPCDWCSARFLSAGW